ncbi:Hypothetical predicted protein [Cloeon dipterum]|uniref:Uncharacterized protein n=1 Tax=Cloeon dipterum TaxID=197152 RepID=A0A8S1C305_9INSE|nr:Hypothetical predicted protein [Cloeon dipterum]
MPPIMVKSHLVWKANSVSAKHTTAVMPTAMNTASPWWNELITPIKNDSASVNTPSKMKFIGALRRT